MELHVGEIRTTRRVYPAMVMKLRSLPIMTVAVLSLGVSAYADQWSKQWTTGPNPELRVETGDGSVVVTGTPYNNKIEARVITNGWKIGPSDVRIDEHFDNNRLELTVHVPTVHFSIGNRSVRVELRVPQSIASTIHTGDGSINLEDLKGVTRLTTGDGSITAVGLDGTIEARTGDGSVKVRGRFDGVQVHTKDGSVNVQAAAGSKMGAAWQIETGDGSATLSVPADLAADLETHTGDGHISVNLPMTISDRRTDHEVRGRLNGGGASLIVRTGDGSINISKS
jgi:DUF4097 and DUF4098 domain-containing protein YvlB